MLRPSEWPDNIANSVEALERMTHDDPHDFSDGRRLVHRQRTRD